MVIARRAGAGVRWVVGVELKWWRQSDAANAGNRRRELVRDFIRAASLYRLVESSSFVGLLSTTDSWNRTTNTGGRDAPAMALIRGVGQQAWNVHALRPAPAVRGAAHGLNGAVPVPKHFRSELLSSVALDVDGHEAVRARVWRVWKYQSTRFFTPPQLQTL